MHKMTFVLDDTNFAKLKLILKSERRHPSQWLNLHLDSLPNPASLVVKSVVTTTPDGVTRDWSSKKPSQQGPQDN